LKDEHHLTTEDLLSHIEKSGNVPSIKRQTELLGISRSCVYYTPVPTDPFTLAVMNKIDEEYTKRPYYGSRRIAKEIGNQWGLPINRKRIQLLMRKMGLEAIYPKPNLSFNSKLHPVYPYLLRGVTANHPNHIWGTDITYIRMNKGFLYLTAFMDWYSRFVVAWRLSAMLTTEFVIDAAKEALSLGIPEITNSDQGIQYTSSDYLSLWDPDKTKISMDGRGRAMDNIFTERLWRSVKYDEVYIKNYQTVIEAKEGIGAYLYDYNYGRLHESLNYKKPAEVYFERR
jgi:putative transposase